MNRPLLLFRLVNVFPQFRFVIDWLLCFLIVVIHASGISILKHPCFGNFDSAVSIDVNWMTSCVDGLFNPATGIPVRVMINKFNLVPNRNVPETSRSAIDSDAISRDKLLIFVYQ